MQRFVLFLGHPGYSIPVVLTSLLISAGIGSLVSKRMVKINRMRVSICLVGIPIILLALGLSMPIMVQALLGHPLVIRIAAIVFVVSIPGFLMGMPFPLGLSVVSRFGSTIIAWVYGINAVFSVLGTILVILIAMRMGFTVAMGMAAVFYGMALVLIWPFLESTTGDSSVRDNDTQFSKP